MRIFTIGGLILAGWLGIGAYWHTCKIKCLCGDGPDKGISEVVGEGNSQPIDAPGGETETESVSWQAFQGPKSIFGVSAHPGCETGSANLDLKPPASDMLDSLETFLKQNPHQSLEMAGFYRSDELNKTKYANLGLARAHHFRELLIERGVDEHRLIPRGKLVGAEALLTLGLNFEDSDHAIEDDEIRNKILYSSFGSAAFKADPELDAYADQLKGYLSRHAQEVVTLTGHTDNVGNPENNRALGLKRAQSVCDYLVRKGISKKRFKVASEGEDSPIASNDTEAGRKKNRRIEITIQ